jgi:basic amino acid/polyamine antiporter, APA family
MNPTGQLPRVLGLTIATAIVVGTVIGSGVFKKASFVSERVPEVGLALLAWVLVGVLTLLGALALAEVAVIVGKAGGNYAILRDAYGRWAGFLWGWVEFWIIRSGSIAALATIFTESLNDILRQLHPKGPDVEVLTPWLRTGVTATVIAVLGWVNARGTKLGGGLQVVVTTVKVASLLAIALLPFIVMAFTRSAAATPTADTLTPLWPSDLGAVNWVAFGGALVGVFWAYHGWMNIAPVAEEVVRPQRNIPLALLTGVGIIILLYLSVNLAYYRIIPSSEIAGLKDRTVVGEFSVRLLGPIGLLVASAAVMTSVFGSLNGNLLVGPRLLYAMGQDGLAPRALARLHPQYATPFLAEVVLAGWSILLVLLVGLLTTYRLPEANLAGWSIDFNLPAKAAFDVITDFAMFGAISFETLAVASIFVFRRRFPVGTVQLPYRCPFYPVLPAVYVAALAAVLVNMFWSQRAEALTGVGFILVGALVYALIGRRKRGA